MKWERRIPDRAGYWLRYNAGHQVSLYRVWYERTLGNALTLIWGSGDEGKLMKVKSRGGRQRLGGWQWYGPIPRPTGEPFEPPKARKQAAE